MTSILRLQEVMFECHYVTNDAFTGALLERGSGNLFGAWSGVAPQFFESERAAKRAPNFAGAAGALMLCNMKTDL